MEKSRNSKDKEAYGIISEELAKFNLLVKGHEKLLRAIGSL